MPVLGRSTIRKSVPQLAANIHGMAPQPRQSSTRIKLWSIESDPKPGSTMYRLKDAYLQALASVDAIDGKREEILRSGQFTESGVKSRMLDLVKKEVPTFARGRKLLAAAKREAAALRAELKLSPPDPADIRGEMIRAELRAVIRGMNAEERGKLLANPDGIDPAIAAAIVHAPALASGVDETKRERLQTAALRAQAGDRLDQLDQLETAIEVAQSAIEAGHVELRFESGIENAAEFDKAAAAIASSIPDEMTPWLQRQHDGSVRVFDLESNKDRAPTDEELKRGRFFKDYAEFKDHHKDAA